MGFACGIVGLPNVGKSTLFNALSATQQAEAANYPFCTIEPNVGVVPVPDPRLDALVALVKPKKIVPTTLEFVDIAGLVRGASQGRRPGQPVPRQHPRGRRDRSRGALLRGREHRPRRGQVDPVARHRDHRHRAVPQGPRDGREAPASARRRRSKGPSQDREADRRAVRALVEGSSTRACRCARRPLDRRRARALIRELHLLTVEAGASTSPTSTRSSSPTPWRARTRTSRRCARSPTNEDAPVVVICAAARGRDLDAAAKRSSPSSSTSLGLDEPGLNKVVRAGYELLGLITYFTAGETGGARLDHHEGHARRRRPRASSTPTSRRASSRPRSSGGKTS